MCGLGVCLDGLALCPDIHSYTISAVKEKYIRRPSKQIKEGCPILLWTHLRDYHLENTTSQSSVGGPLCNCILPDLQISFHSFIPDILLHKMFFLIPLSFFGILAAVTLVTKRRLSHKPVTSVQKMQLVEKQMIPHI